MPRWVLLLALLLAASSPAQPTLSGTRPDGRPVPALVPPGTRAVVLFFVASDCPVSNRTFPEMQRLRERFTPLGVRFWFVYPNTGEPPATILQHQAAFDPGGEPLVDPTGALVRLAAARVTPEASILVPSEGKAAWRPVYTGRIDDRYIHFGQERPQATAHFAERALTAVLAGTPVAPATGVPVGCAIVSPGVPKATPR